MIQAITNQYRNIGIKRTYPFFVKRTSLIEIGSRIVNTQSFTVECWYMTPNRTSGDAGHWLINERGAPTSEFNYQLLVSVTTYSVRCSISLDGVNLTNIGSFSIQDNTWYHLAMVCDFGAGELALYVNGNKTDSVAISGTRTLNSPSRCVIGSGAWQDSIGGPCNIDECRFWDHARSQDQIRKYMNVELQGRETGLVAYYRLNEGTGTTIYDNTPGGKNGTALDTINWITP
jgi:hypothetical protein